MTLTFSREKFSDAVALVSKIISPRPVSPVLSGVLISTDGSGNLQIRASGEAGVCVVVLEAESVEAFAALVNGRQLTEIVRSMDAKEVSLTCNEKILEVECGRASYEFNLMPIENYPKFQFPDAVVTRILPGSSRNVYLRLPLRLPGVILSLFIMGLRYLFRRSQ